MKKITNLYGILAGVWMLASCSPYTGTEPGNDSVPSVVLYTFTPQDVEGHHYNSDNDIQIRFATNNQCSEVRYVAEKTADYTARVQSLGSEEGYLDYVASNGTQVTLSGSGIDDVVLTELYGDYTITAVAIKGDARKGATATFRGLDWEDVVTGTYYFALASKLGVSSNATTLQVCTTDPTLYRFKDVFAPGWSLKIVLLPDYQATDDDGTYTYFRVPVQQTPFTYGSHGAVGIRDIGYWQGNDAFVTDYGYESGMYQEDHFCFVFVQYFVSAGSIGYNYDLFYPD